jgi:hypothetical protein
MNKRGKSGKTSTRAMLLPPTAGSVRELSLRYHLALAALRSGEGNGYLLSELIRVLYVAWYLHEVGYGQPAAGLFADAEAALDRSASRATRDDAWHLEPRECAAVEKLLALHDEQLQQAPIKAMLEVQKRLAHFARSDRRTPWQKDKRAAASG